MTSLTLWRAEIGNFYNCSHKVRIKRHSFCPFSYSFKISSTFLVLFAITSECLNLNFVPFVTFFCSLLNYFFDFVVYFIKPYKNFRTFCTNLLLLILILTQMSFLLLALICCGDIEINQGPDSSSWKSLSICHWNLTA